MDLILRLVEAEIPVMAHIGLTPQSVNALGGFRVQGRTEAAAKQFCATPTPSKPPARFP